MTKKQKTGATIAALAIIGIGGYIAYEKGLFKKQKPDIPPIPYGKFPDTTGSCPDSPQYIGWKARGAITDGLTRGFNPNWTRLYYNVPKCLILDWIWELRRNAEWAQHLRGKELFRAAEYQAAKQIGAKTIPYRNNMQYL